MTIAAGFLCRDGIAICADQELTHGDAGKTKAKKIWYSQWEDSSAVITGATNNWGYLNTAAQSILKAVSACNSLDIAESLIRDTLRAIFDDIARERGYSDPPIVLDLIVGLASNGEQRMLRSEGLAVRETNGIEFVGSGAILAFSHCGLFFPDLTDIVVLPSLSEAQRLGTYILQKVKQSALGAGGKTDLCVLLPSGEIGEFGVRYLEKMFSELHVILRQLVLAHSDLSCSGEKFDQELSSITERLRSMKDNNSRRHNWLTQIADECDPDV